MGMYTELVFKASFNKERTPPEVIGVLSYLFNHDGDWKKPDIIPDHPFFSCHRWELVGRCSSWYHHPNALSSWVDEDFSRDTHIFNRSDLKNYNNEIDEFIRWIQPYISEYEGECIGWKLYEEDDKPTLLFKT